MRLFNEGKRLTTYYASTTDSDNGAGTQTSPWASINHALEANLKPGDTNMVAPGTSTRHGRLSRGQHHAAIPGPGTVLIRRSR